MKRILLYAIILIAVVLLPVQSNDVGKLEPVQTVAVYLHAGEFLIATDTDDYGRGATLRQAFENLTESTPGIIYLDTADYLLIDPSALNQIEELRDVLKDSVALYLFQGTPDLQKASKFLSVHGNGPRLKKWENGAILPVLQCINGQMILS